MGRYTAQVRIKEEIFEVFKWEEGDEFITIYHYNGCSNKKYQRANKEIYNCKDTKTFSKKQNSLLHTDDIILMAETGEEMQELTYENRKIKIGGEYK